MRIAVVGSGYVGLVAGACFADLGHDVILVDNDQRKLAALRNGQVPIHEKFLPELLSRHRGNRLTFSDDLQEAVRQSAAIFVAVGTPPTRERRVTLSTSNPSRAKSPCGIRTDTRSSSKKRTVPVYTSEWVRKIILRSGTPMRNRSMLRRIQNSCARAQPSRTSCFPIASSSAATPNAQPTSFARSMPL